MTRRIIDISMPIENEVISDPLPYNPKVTYFNHHQSYEQMAPFFPGLKKEDLPDGEARAVDIPPPRGPGGVIPPARRAPTFGPRRPSSGPKPRAGQVETGAPGGQFPASAASTKAATRLPEALTMCSGPGKRPSFTSATNSRKAETRSACISSFIL